MCLFDCKVQFLQLIIKTRLQNSSVLSGLDLSLSNRVKENVMTSNNSSSSNPPWVAIFIAIISFIVGPIVVYYITNSVRDPRSKPNIVEQHLILN